MEAALRQDRLETVCAMAATLADRILMGRVTGRPPPIANGEALWIASLLLEVNDQPVPVIVTEALSQFRPSEDDDEPEPSMRRDPYRNSSLTRVLFRLLPPYRATASV